MQNGFYKIKPNNTSNCILLLVNLKADFLVYCDMQSDEGGWTLIATIADDNNDYWFIVN